ncbi:hypothetical protein GCM10010466_35900 [Planomonospora alba]|uniref:Uncharacterized protein n=1 Tax=Planomonospora alba TaxID=161354 RepID=A0ABP6NAG8_9ACTN
MSDDGPEPLTIGWLSERTRDAGAHCYGRASRPMDAVGRLDERSAARPLDEQEGV